WLVVALWAWPAMDPHRSPKVAMADLEQRLPASAELGLLDFKEQFLLYARRPLTHFSYLAPLAEQERNAWQWMRERPDRWLLLPGSDRLACFDLSRAQPLVAAHRREWVLLDASALRPDCPPPQQVRRYTWQP